MSNSDTPVCVVDDDASIREGVGSLVRSAGLRAETFASAEEFLASPRAAGPGCLVLDVELPGLSGLDLQQQLAKSDVQIPIIFLTGRGDIPMTVRAIKAGAVEFLTKPVDDEDLLDAIRQGIASCYAPQQPCRSIGLRQENVRLEERTRIAQELHDTLLQTFLGALLQLGVAVESLPADSQAKSRLDRILQFMQQGIEEGRKAIQGLRSPDHSASDLVVALSAIRQEFPAQAGLDFRVSVVGHQQTLRSAIQDEIYRIGREALVNAFSHSGATRIDLQLEYADGNLTMRVRDNGCGIDPQVLDTGREGHWGLTGMRERAMRIGGLLTISNSATPGTEVQLSLPADVALCSRTSPTNWLDRSPGCDEPLCRSRIVPERGRETELFLVDDNEPLHAAPCLHAIQRNLLLKLAGQAVSNRELRGLLREIMASIRGAVHSDGACIFLGVPDVDELEGYSIDFRSDTGNLKEGVRVSSSDTITSYVLWTGKPWGGSCEQAWDLFRPQLTCGPAFKQGCMVPLSGHQGLVGVLGLFRAQPKPFSEDEIEFLVQVSPQITLAVQNALAHRENSDLKYQLSQEKLCLEDEGHPEMNFAEIVGNSLPLRKVLKRVETVAPTDSTVLIYGETGAGKELVARAIHDLSTRRSKPFVKLNCAAIPTGLLESELFGHERGAFTGAVAQRIGRFEAANGGTIFLDEIGEIPLELQTKLLRVLQEREFERLGSSRTLRTDARLVAATNRDLQAMVGEQRFRPDLFFRLNVFPVHVPPLRERKEDIPLLVRHFAQQFSKNINKAIDTIGSASMDALCSYHWPGNIRELQNVIERATIVSTGPSLEVDMEDLRPAKPSTPTENTLSFRAKDATLDEALQETERHQILRALKQSNWVVAGPNGAAAKLGMKRSTLQLRIYKLGISRTRA